MVGFGGFGSSMTNGSRSGRVGVTVAPFNANPDSKKKADVILTGVNDEIKINNAINTLCKNPNSVFGNWKVSPLHFLEGQINLGGPIYLIDSITVSGSGYSTIFKLQDNANCDMFTHEDYSNTLLYKVTLRNFLIDGNYVLNMTNTPTGIKIRPQEYLIDGLWITNCYNGLTLYGENTYGGFIQNCMIQNNFNYGLGLGGDSIVVGCGISGNGNTPAAEYSFGASGIYIAGWNNQINSCHFANNLTDIFSNWAAYNQVQACIFEAGIKECIRLEGRVWGWHVVGNRFGGRRAHISNNSFDCITMRFIDANEKAYGNIFTNNSFTVYETRDVGYNYCIVETANCDRNLIANNVFNNGYAQSQPVSLIGENSVSIGNIE